VSDWRGAVTSFGHPQKSIYSSFFKLVKPLSCDGDGPAVGSQETFCDVFQSGLLVKLLYVLLNIDYLSFGNSGLPAQTQTQLPVKAGTLAPWGTR
jgi:hypothetical protein